MTSEQEAIARLRAKAQSSPDDVAWVAGVPYENYVVSTADLRALLDREERLSEALEEMEAAYLALRRGIRSAIAPVHMSNPLVSDEWIIDRVNELRAALEGKLDREKRLTEALEKVKVLARAEDMRPGNAGLPVTAWAFISEMAKISRAALEGTP